MVVVEEPGPEGFFRAVHSPDKLFYSKYGILASPHPSRPQEAPYFLTELVDQVGLRKNVNNMFGIVCQPCCTSGRKWEVGKRREETGGCNHVQIILTDLRNGLLIPLPEAEPDGNI